MPGTWKLTAGGIGFVSGNNVDPLGVTNGYALPGTVEGTISFTLSGGYSGLNDIANDPARGAIEAGVSHRLLDGLSNGKFKPADALTREALAQYAMMGLGIRQNLPLTGGFTFGDVKGPLAYYAEGVISRGGALRDRFQTTKPVVRASGSYNPGAAVTRADLAYTLVQSLGLQGPAEKLNADFASGAKTMAANYGNQSARITDAGSIAADLKGYVQLALDLGLMNARYVLTQGPYDATPTITATFNPATTVTRGAYAVSALAAMNAFRSGDIAAALGYGSGTSSTVPALAQNCNEHDARPGRAHVLGAVPEPGAHQRHAALLAPRGQRACASPSSTLWAARSPASPTASRPPARTPRRSTWPGLRRAPT